MCNFKPLIYTAGFGNPQSYWLNFLWLKSVEESSKNKPLNFDIAVLTDPAGKEYLNKVLNRLKITVEIYVLNSEVNKHKTTWNRYKILDVPEAKNYTHFLYLDNDIWVNTNIEELCKNYYLSMPEHKEILAYSSGKFSNPKDYSFFGGAVFEDQGVEEQEIKNYSKFSTGILFFKNSQNLKKSFLDAETLQKSFCLRNNIPKYDFLRVDQPYINYILLVKNLIFLRPMANEVIEIRNNVNFKRHSRNIHNKDLWHFCGGIGNPNKKTKIREVFSFLNFKKLKELQALDLAE
jgi:hypothetical protein